MTHRLAMMRGDPPIPEIDVTRPALAPTRVIPDGAIPAEDVPELMRRLIPHVKPNAATQSLEAHVAESQAPAPSEPGDCGVAPALEPVGVAAPEFVASDGWIKCTNKAQQKALGHIPIEARWCDGDVLRLNSAQSVFGWGDKNSGCIAYKVLT